MVRIRKSQDRGHAQHGWLESYHTFSFADYHDPEFSGFRDLLVINEDRVAPGKGFGRHGHRDMEIISYVIEGALQHTDNMGTGSVLKTGDVQRMSAGKGVQHSEFNGSPEERVHFLQIWIEPGANGLEPSYQEKRFERVEKLNQLKLIVSPQGRDSSISVYQDTSVYASVLEEGRTIEHLLKPARYGWVQVIRGVLHLNSMRLDAGDGASISDERKLVFESSSESTPESAQESGLKSSPKSLKECEFLLFDLS